MIYYVAYYNPIQEMGKRVANYAGEDKIDYICEKLNQIGESVTILSNTKSISKKWAKKTVYKETKEKRIVMFASLPRCNVILHAVDVLYGYIQLATYILFHVKKNDTVLVYHSLGYRDVIRKIRFIKPFRYILEVEELFQFIDHSTSSFKNRENEIFQYPDAFLFSNRILNSLINTDDRPAVIINGVYKNQKRLFVGKKDSKIKVVYAGSFEPQKGVDYVINAAMYLEPKYEIRIIGFGGQEDTDRVLKLIEKVNQGKMCRVYFDGIFKGDEYIRYLQKCDIGVCIQNPSDKFNLYEFPSKIFSYMTNGLKVVTNRLEQIEQSEVCSYLTIAEDISSQGVAAAIRKANSSKIQADRVLDDLDMRFKEEIKKLVKGE